MNILKLTRPLFGIFLAILVPLLSGCISSGHSPSEDEDIFEKASDISAITFNDQPCVGHIDNRLSPKDAELEGFLIRRGEHGVYDVGLNPKCILEKYDIYNLSEYAKTDSVAAYSYAYYLYDLKKCDAFKEIENHMLFAFEDRVQIISPDGEPVSVYRLPETGHVLYGYAYMCLSPDDSYIYGEYASTSYFRGFGRPSTP